MLSTRGQPTPWFLRDQVGRILLSDELLLGETASGSLILVADCVSGIEPSSCSGTRNSLRNSCVHCSVLSTVKTTLKCKT